MARRQIRTLTPTELARVQQGALVRIVDDDDSLRDALRFVLETEGWRVADYRSANDFFSLKVVQNRHDTQVKMTF